MDAFISRFATEGTLLNLALLGVSFVFYRLYAGGLKARDEDRRAELAARKADADAHAAGLGKIAESLAGVRSLLDMIDRDMERGK